MRINGLAIASLSVIAMTAASCTSNCAEDLMVETSPTIEITVAESPYAAQTRQEASGGIGVICEYGLIAIDEESGKALCDNFRIWNKNISVSTSSWKSRGNAIVYYPHTEEIEYLEEKGSFMIPFDMASSGQVPEISRTFNIGRTSDTREIKVSTEKLTSTLNISIREIDNGKFETGHIIINKVSANNISTKGFYVFDSATGIGHWENQKGHSNISLAINDNQTSASLEAIPEKLNGKHTINLLVETEKFKDGNDIIGATDNTELEFSLSDLLGTQSLEPGVTYNIEIGLDITNILQSIEFSSSVSDWNSINISVN